MQNIIYHHFLSDVVKLRSTPPLFRAYEQAYNNLADNYCPNFHLSKQVGHSMLNETPESLIFGL